MSSESSNCCLIEKLEDYQDSVVKIFTEGGCFKGLLTDVDCDCCKIASCCGNRFSITVIPIDQIEAVTLCNTTF